MERYCGENVDAKIVLREWEYLKNRYEMRQGQAVCITVGTGQKEKWSVLRCKEVYAQGAKQADMLEANSCEVDLTEAFLLGESGVSAAFEGILGALYEQRFALEGKLEKEIRWYWSVSLENVPYKEEELDHMVRNAYELGKDIMWARNMVNMPGNHLIPEQFAKQIVSFVKDVPVETQVYNREELEKMGLHALLSVGDSSANAPYMAVLRYTGNPDADERLGYIGKGVTCDTGGYCVKSAASMKGIKGDMAGAAAVTASIRALANNRVPVNVTAVIPICENRISRESTLVGDVIRGLSGKTIEVLNTDAEGRLILSDAITWAIQKEGATKLVDIATLTGAVVQMLGFVMAGVMASDDAWWKRLQEAAVSSGEKYWRMPMEEEYEKLIESDYADMQNTSRDGCASVAAGLFLHRFTEGLPWLHLDIAGTASVPSPIWAFQSAGATGAGTSTLYYLAKQEENQKNEKNVSKDNCEMGE